MKQNYFRFLFVLINLLSITSWAQIKDDDAGLYSLWTTTPPCNDSVSLYVRLTNYSFFNELKSADIKVAINGNVVGVKNWSGLIPLYRFDTIYLGKFALEKKLNNVVAWTENPNNSKDTENGNDTAKIQINGLFLNGTYTIGGVSPDFKTIKDALTFLSKGLVCSDVTFNIRPGTYKEPFEISKFSTNSWVTFQSEDQNSASVKIEYNSAMPSSYQNALVNISQGGKIIFKNLTFNQTCPTYNYMVYLTVSDHCKIDGCVFNATANTDRCLTYSSNNICTVQNCTFNGGGVAIEGQTLIVKNCSFKDQSSGSIKGSITEVSSNTVTNTKAISSFNAFDITSYRASVYNNKIISNAGYGIRYGINYGKIYNNYVSISSLSGFGLYQSYSDSAEVYHNTVRINGDASSNVFFAEDRLDNVLLLKNNIFINTGSGYVLYFYGTSSGKIINSNTNFLYTTGKNKFRLKDIDYQTMAAYQATGQDAQSVFKIPYFVNSSTYITQDIDLFKGIKIPFITTDIDGRPRSFASSCIGAFESGFYKTDAKVGRLVLNDSLLCSAEQPVEVSLKNAGSDVLTSATINWSIDGGALKTYNWTGNLTTSDSAKILLETISFHPSLTHTISIYASSVNGGVDNFHGNDTLIYKLKSRLKGTYFIGAVGADFKTIKEAVSLLATNGVCGPVNFKLNEGAYDEVITIPSIYGSSAINTITFESASGDSTKVSIISYQGSPFTINNDHMRFHKLGFTMNALNTNSIISLNNRKNIRVTNCRFQLNTGCNAVSVSGVGDVQILNCKFTDGSPNQNGVPLYASSPGSSLKVVFKNNVITNCLQGVYLKNVDTVLISNCIFSSSSITINNNANYLEISNNKMINTKDIAIILHDFPANPSAKRIVKNNFINGPFEVDFSQNVEFYFNTITSNDNLYKRPLCYFYGSTKCIFKNNIVYATGKLHLINDDGNSSNNNIYDYNSYYTPNDSAFSVYTTDRVYYHTLSQWQAVTKRDYNSLFIKPQFISANDLHLNNDININNKGVAINGITTDFDGELRGSVPDIGADEFTATPLDIDASIPGFDQAFSNCDADSTHVKVKLLNNGKNTLNTATINWVLNGIPQTPYNWTGNLVTYESQLITLGSFIKNFNATYTVTASCSLPNGQQDMNTANDTNSISPLHASLKGTYTIGANGKFLTPTEACTYLNKFGVCGPVVFKIENGTYNNEAMKLYSITGSSDVNTITFMSASNKAKEVVINSKTSDTTISLNGCKYVMFKALSITSTGIPIYQFLMRLKNVSSISFDSVEFSGPDIISKGSNFNLSFKNCIVSTRFLIGDDVLQSKGLLIKDCLFPKYTGLYLLNTDSALIINNHISAPIISGTYANPAPGINALRCNNISILKNYIEGQFSTGISLSSSGTASKPCLIANNSLSGSKETGSLISFSGSYIDILYNSCNLMYASSTGGTGVVIYGDFSNNVRLKNNILVNNGSGTAITMADFSNFPETDYNIIYTKNNTDIQYKSKQYTLSNYQALSGKETHSTAANPQYISNTDLHSKNTALNGLATPIANIQDDIQNKLRNAFMPNPGAFEFPANPIFDSIHKDLSLKVPADTFKVGNNNLSVQLISNIVVNPDPNYVFTGNIDTVDLYYQLNQESIITEQWIGKLSMGQSTTYTFQTPINIPKGRLYRLRAGAKIHSLNGIIDVNSLNDTINKQMKVRMAGTYYIGGVNPDFMDGDTAASEIAICHSSAPVKFIFRPGQYSLLHLGGLDTVRIESETRKKEDVELKIKTITCWNKTFKNISINVVPEAPYKAILLSGYRNIIDSCIVKGDSTISGFFIVDNLNNLTITNNTFTNLDVGIQFQPKAANSSFYGKEEISWNTFDHVNTILFVNSNNSRIIPDDYIRFHHNKLFNYQTGIRVTGSNSIKMKVYNNELTNAEKSAIYLHDITTTLDVSFYNNFISGGEYFKSTFQSPTSGSGKYDARKTIKLENVLTSTFTNNSVYGSLVLTNSYASLMNNSVFADTMVTYISDNNSVSGSNYNSMYTNGKFLAILTLPANTKAAINMDEFKDITNGNSRSFSYNPYYTSFTDLHSNSVLLKNKGFSAGIQTDFDDQPRNLSKPDVGADEIDLVEDMVWPGDANADSRADNIDLLSIGLYHSETGVSRTLTGNNWAPYVSTNWLRQQYTGVNFKHADCNGDGTINDDDTLAIIQNFNQFHNFNHRINTTPSSAIINDLFFIMPHPKAVYAFGDTIFAEIWLGRNNKPEMTLYGIAFNISTVAACIKPGSFKINVRTNWLADQSNSLCLDEERETQGIAYAAIVRKDHISGTGKGKIGEFYFIYNGNAPQNGIPLNFGNVIPIDDKGNIIDLIAHDNNANHYKDIYTSISSTEETKERLTVYPNPVKDYATINYTLSKSTHVKLDIYSSTGQLIKVFFDQQQAPGPHQFELDLPSMGLSEGIYLLKLNKGEHILMEKLMIGN